MPLLRKPLYQRGEGADQDRWRLAFDLDTRRLFVKHDKIRGDMRGPGYSTDTDEMELSDLLRESGEGQRELVRLLGEFFAEHEDARR